MVVLTTDLAQALHLQPGGTLHLPTPTGLVDLPVVGVVLLPGESNAMMPLATVQELYATQGRINAIDVAVAAGSDRDSLQQALQAETRRSVQGRQRDAEQRYVCQPAARRW